MRRGMNAHTSLIRVCMAPVRREMPAHCADEDLIVVVRGPHTAAVTAVVKRRSLLEPTTADSGLPRPAVGADEHLRAGPDEADPTMMSAADVIVRRAGGGHPGPHSLPDIRARYPGCLVAAVIGRDRTCVWAGDPGHRLQFASLPETRPIDRAVKRRGSGSEAGILCCASVVHAWLAAARPLAGLHAARLTVSPPRGAARHCVVRVRSMSRSPGSMDGEVAWRAGC